MTDKYDEAMEARLRRINYPDGKCYHCEEPANRLSPVGPLNVKISEPNEPGGFMHEFCCWECLAHWAARSAGGKFVVVT